MPIYFGYLIIFAIAFATLGLRKERSIALTRGFDDWVVDFTSLGMHFVIIPILQTLTVFKLLDAFASPLFMVYFWLIPIVLYFAADPIPFLSFSMFGLVVNFWGHTSFTFKQGSFMSRGLALFLVQPEDHFWHHSAENPRCNYGTVLNFWDRIHGTWHRPERAPSALGFNLDMSLVRKLFFPF